MISEGSCDTEDWSNDAETYIIIFRNISIFTKFLINKCILGEQKRLLLKIYIFLKSLFSFFLHYLDMTCESHPCLFP